MTSNVIRVIIILRTKSCFCENIDISTSIIEVFMHVFYVSVKRLCIKITQFRKGWWYVIERGDAKPKFCTGCSQGGELFFKKTTYNRWRKRHGNLVSTLTLTLCDPPALKNPGYAPVAVDLNFSISFLTSGLKAILLSHKSEIYSPFIAVTLLSLT